MRRFELVVRRDAAGGVPWQASADAGERRATASCDAIRGNGKSAKKAASDEITMRRGMSCRAFHSRTRSAPHFHFVGCPRSRSNAGGGDEAGGDAVDPALETLNLGQPDTLDLLL